MFFAWLSLEEKDRFVIAFDTHKTVKIMYIIISLSRRTKLLCESDLSHFHLSPSVHVTIVVLMFGRRFEPHISFLSSIIHRCRPGHIDSIYYLRLMFLWRVRQFFSIVFEHYTLGVISAVFKSFRIAHKDLAWLA